MHDLVIRGGTIVDGTGAEPFEGDLAFAGGRIAELGEVPGRGREEIDARGKLVTPGFVDVHPTSTDRSPGIRTSRRRRGTV
jgi:N-acyl-D-aspartate/D-glutamate deacylase